MDRYDYDIYLVGMTINKKGRWVKYKTAEKLEKENKLLKEYARHKYECGLSGCESDVFEFGKIKCKCGLYELLKTEDDRK